MSRRTTTLLAAFAISVACAGSQVGISEAGTRPVVLMDIAFTPQRLSIRAGSSVVFEFLEPDTDHNVISRGRKRFKSISARTTGSVKRTFRHGGTYRYECTLHPGMTGRIVVR